MSQKLGFESEVPLSLSSRMVLQQLQANRQAKPKISYNRDFLDEYIPNVTQYLSPQTCFALKQRGTLEDEIASDLSKKRKLFERLLIDLSWNSSRLEGNTYSFLETSLLLKLNQIPEGKHQIETQMILNHKEAIKFLIDGGLDYGISPGAIKRIHRLLSINILKNPQDCGNLRTYPVGIEKSCYEPLSIPPLINECFEQIIQTAKAIQNPFEQAFFFMVHLPYLQPFLDVNKRVSRLAANIPLLQSNHYPLSFHKVPKDAYINGMLAVYELNKVDVLRDVFVWSYERSADLYAEKSPSLVS